MNIIRKGKTFTAVFGAIGALAVNSVALAQVDVFADKATFEQLTGATAAAIPPANNYALYPGVTGFGCAGEIITAVSGVTITVTAPDATPVFEFAHGICVIEADATPYDASFPQPAVARSIVGVGPDNYDVDLNAPTHAIGFELITNTTGQGTVALFDANDNLVTTHNFSAAPNTVAFLGFRSTTAVQSARLILPNGDVQDVGLIGIELGQVLAPISVSVDIKPGGYPNSINLKSNGVLPVAVLTTATFNAATLNPTTVRFGSTGTEAVPTHSALSDVNRDGRLDRIFHFDSRGVGIQCSDTSASLTGETFAGNPIRGTDTVRVLGCPGAK